METGVEKTEATIEPRRHAGMRIENDRPNKCRGVIAALLQNFWQVRQQRRQRMTKIGHGMKLWVRSSEDCRVRYRGQRSL